jgi:hypothetical protein
MIDEMTVLLATGPDGRKWKDPSEDLIHMLLKDLSREGGPVGNLRLERLGSPEKEVLVVCHDKGCFQVQRERGLRVATAASETLLEVHAACTRWAFQIDSAKAARARQIWGGYDGTLAWQITGSD